MTQLPAWLLYGTAYATIFSGLFVGAAGIVFSVLQLRFANGQPKRDLEAHRRALKAAKNERLIADFAVILRHSMAQKPLLIKYHYVKIIKFNQKFKDSRRNKCH